jgi:hypothetical protein
MRGWKSWEGLRLSLSRPALQMALVWLVEFDRGFQEGWLFKCALLPAGEPLVTSPVTLRHTHSVDSFLSTCIRCRRYYYQYLSETYFVLPIPDIGRLTTALEKWYPSRQAALSIYIHYNTY